MKLSVGPFDYAIRRQWRLTDGDRLRPVALNGLTIFHELVIWIDAELKDEYAIATLRHEFSEAWAHHCGEPSDHEGRRQSEATIGTSFDQQFTAQGGLAAFLAIPVEGMPSEDKTESSAPTQPKAQEKSYRVTDTIVCPGCESHIRTAGCTTSAAKLNDAGIFVVHRWLLCDACDSVIAWCERSTPEGFPLGEYFRASILRGNDARCYIDMMTAELEATA